VTVGLNLIYLVPGEIGGMETVARELLPHLPSQAPGLEWVAFFSREGFAAVREGDLELPEPIRTVEVPVRSANRTNRVLAEQGVLPYLAARNGVSLLHSLASTAPRIAPCKQVVTVHDLIYLHYPEAHQGVRSVGVRLLVPVAVRAAQLVLVPSLATKRDLERLLGVAASRIEVVPWGVRKPTDPAPEEVERVRLTHRLGEAPVVLALSARRPHKNISGLLRGLAAIPEEERPILVLPGYHTWHERELVGEATALGISSSVRFLGWVDQEELEALWRSATCFVHPAFYEGFGLPVLEAMARGVPVACANASSLPEVAGDAALLFDPHDPKAIAAAIQRLISDEQLREELRRRGLERASQFSWEAAARKTVRAYAKALGFAAPPASWGVAEEGAVAARDGVGRTAV